MLNAHFLNLINIILNHLSKELLLWGKDFNKPIGEQVEGKKHRLKEFTKKSDNRQYPRPELTFKN